MSQNNVARETGRDSSALRKSRYPGLIAEIQQWIEANATDKPKSPRQILLAQSRRNRSLRDKIEALKIQRDHALSLLTEADAKILELNMENRLLQNLQSQSKITPVRKPRKK